MENTFALAAQSFCKQPSRFALVAGLSLTAEERVVRRKLNLHSLCLDAIQFCREQEGRFNGCLILTFKSIAEAEKFVNSTVLAAVDGLIPRVGFLKDAKAALEQQSQFPNLGSSDVSEEATCMIIIRGIDPILLTWLSLSNLLKDRCKEAFNGMQLSVARERSNRQPLGFAFVRMPSKEQSIELKQELDPKLFGPQAQIDYAFEWAEAEEYWDPAVHLEDETAAFYASIAEL